MSLCSSLTLWHYRKCDKSLTWCWGYGTSERLQEAPSASMSLLVRVMLLGHTESQELGEAV